MGFPAGFDYFLEGWVKQPLVLKLERGIRGWDRFVMAQEDWTVF